MSEIAAFAHDLNPFARYSELTRFRVYLALWSLICAINTTMFFVHLLGQGLHGWTWFYLSVVATVPFTVWPRVTRLRRPKRYRLDEGRLRALSRTELERLAEVVGQAKEFAADSGEPLAEISLGMPHNDKDIWTLVRAGLLEDFRDYRGQSFLHVRVVPGVEEVLEREQERRERPAPLGNRSRPGALAG